MTTELLKRKSSQDWQGVIGLPLEAVTEKLLQGGWLERAGTRLHVIEEKFPYCIRVQQREDDINGIPQMPLTFMLQFNYEGDPSSLRIRSVFFEKYKYAGLGSEFLRKTATLAIGMGYDKIHVYPHMEGSCYWPSRGALIQEWPSGIRRGDFEDAFKDFWNNRHDFAPDWTSADFDAVKEVYDQQDPFMLNKLLARDDLLVYTAAGVEVPFRRVAVTNVDLGRCIFKLAHFWTREQLLNRCHCDVAAEIARRATGPDRPVFSTTGQQKTAQYGIITSAPAS